MQVKVRSWLAAALAFALMLPAGEGPAQERPATVAAASDLKFALQEIAAAFRTETRRELRFVFGSSGNFTRQIEQGAPFELFFSADEQFVFRLADKGLTRDRGALYARGRLALFVPRGSPLKAEEGLAGLRAAFAGGRIHRFAIANPEHAPYGRAAQQALRHQGLWDSLQPRLVLGENVSQAAQFAASQSAQGGLIAYSLAIAPDLARLGEFALIPEEWHDPLDQRMVLLKSAGETAVAFFVYVQAEPARTVLRRFGFIVPEN
jgi:molybdate transport system substrate-binding protein